VVIADADDDTLCFLLLFEVNVLDMRRRRNLFEFACMLSKKRRRERDEGFEEDKKERSFILDDEDVEDA